MTMPTTGRRSCRAPQCSCSRCSCVEGEGGVDDAVGQVAGRGDRPRAHLGEVVAQRRHVAELAAGALALAVPVQLHVGPVRHEVVHPLVQARPVPVRRRPRPRPARWPSRRPARSSRWRRAGSRGRRAGAARTGWCATPSIVQWPELCGRMASSLTSDAVGGLEQLDGEHPDDARAGRRSGRRAPAPRSPAASAQARRRGEHLGADAVALHGLDDRPDRDLPERRAGHLRGELAHHRDPLLDQQRAVPLEQRRPPRRGRRRRRRPCRRSRRAGS